MDGPGGDPGAGVYHGASRTKRLRTSPIAPLGAAPGKALSQLAIWSDGRPPTFSAR